MNTRCLAVAVAAALGGCDVVVGVDKLYKCTDLDDDCDTLPNTADPCPADRGDSVDTDGDLVGDDCDPNVAISGDALLAFESFVLRDPRWVESGAGGLWTIDESHFKQSSIVDSVIERPVEANIQPTVEVFLDAELPTNGASVGVYVSSTNDIPLECRIVHTQTGDDLVMILPTVNNQIIDTAKNLPGKLSDGVRIYGGQLPDGTVRCRARFGDADALFVDWVGILPPRDNFSKVGFRTLDASMSVRALAIYVVP